MAGAKKRIRALSMPITVCQPGYEMPHCPTRPLWGGTFFNNHSIVSCVSVLSSTPPGFPSMV